VLLGTPVFRSSSGVASSTSAAADATAKSAARFSIRRANAAHHGLRCSSAPDAYLLVTLSSLAVR
jgi:hypothetical protein